MSHSQSQTEKISAQTFVCSALKLYFRNVNYDLLLNNDQRIAGSLQEVSRFIVETVHFVDELASSSMKCPFQYDAVFVFPRMVSRDDPDDDDDDDDSEDFEHFQGQNMAKMLSTSKVKHVESEWRADNDQKDHNVLQHAVNELSTMIGDEAYPRFHRLISIADFTDEGSRRRRVVTFQPMEATAKIHEKPIAFHFFNNTKVDAEDIEHIFGSDGYGPHFTV